MQDIKGKIEVINHPIVKGKNGRSPLYGIKWKYENGVMTSQWMIGGRRMINLPLVAKSVETSNEVYSLLGSLKQSNALTPEYMAAGAASPLLMMLYQDKKFKDLRTKKTLIEVEFKEGFSPPEPPIVFPACEWRNGFMGFTSFEVYAQLHDLLNNKEGLSGS